MEAEKFFRQIYGQRYETLSYLKDCMMRLYKIGIWSLMISNINNLIHCYGVSQKYPEI